MITWIYLIGVLVTFIACIIKITANDMLKEFNEPSGRLEWLLSQLSS